MPPVVILDGNISSLHFTRTLCITLPVPNTGHAFYSPSSVPGRRENQAIVTLPHSPSFVNLSDPLPASLLVAARSALHPSKRPRTPTVSPPRRESYAWDSSTGAKTLQPTTCSGISRYASHRAQGKDIRASSGYPCFLLSTCRLELRHRQFCCKVRPILHTPVPGKATPFLLTTTI